MYLYLYCPIIIGHYINKALTKEDNSMKKIQTVYRHLAEEVLKDRKRHFVMRDVARTLRISPNTVSIAAGSLGRIGAITRYEGYFSVTNFEKLLGFWAVERNLDKDIIYKTYVEEAESEIEKRMPAEVAFTCYSAYVALFGNDVSEYSGVYVYATEKGLDEIKKRFPERRLSERSDYTNLTVLKPDVVLEERINNGSLEKASVSLPQIYVDLWNNKDWYAYEFLKKLKHRVDGLYAKAVL